jgi:hypothetical protein
MTPSNIIWASHGAIVSAMLVLAIGAEAPALYAAAFTSIIGFFVGWFCDCIYPDNFTQRLNGDWPDSLDACEKWFEGLNEQRPVYRNGQFNDPDEWLDDPKQDYSKYWNPDWENNRP